MKRYLIHKINHTVLLVDLTPIGLPAEVYPPEGRKQVLDSFRFQTTAAAQQFLVNMGAELGVLNTTLNTVKQAGIAVLTITD
jgi:hypothetical protein